MSYLRLAGIAKVELTTEHTSRMLELIENDSRVKKIQPTDNPIIFYIEADEIENGEYTVGTICNHLRELPSTRAKRLKEERKPLPDVIHIEKFTNYEERPNTAIRSLPSLTLSRIREALIDYPPSTDKAQLVNTLSFKLHGNETIADRILRDHVSIDGAKRHASLLLSIKCANEINRVGNYHGTYVFEDGSKL